MSLIKNTCPDSLRHVYEVKRYTDLKSGKEVYQRVRAAYMLYPNMMSGGGVDPEEAAKAAVWKADDDKATRFFGVGLIILVDPAGNQMPHQFCFDIPETNLAAAFDTWDQHMTKGRDKELNRIRGEQARAALQQGIGVPPLR